jgi:hypothetical protein
LINIFSSLFLVVPDIDAKYPKKRQGILSKKSLKIPNG